MTSRLDQLYRRLLLTKFFTKGWGKPDNLKRLFDFRKVISNRELCRHLVPSDYPVHIEREYADGDCRVLEGYLISPLTHHLPGIVPKEVEKASFQVLLPKQWKHNKLKPVCIHLAGTGDHFYWRRRIFMAKPMLKESGIASIMLENPFYGSRKPKGQIRSSLHNVSDLFVMGGALILESLALLHWCQRQGYGPLGITGISMGGHMASLAATNWHEPLSLIPCLSWSTASAVFTQGVMSGAIPWKTLETQFFENSVYQDEISHLICSPEEQRSQQAYTMGQEFVKEFTHHFDNLQQMHENFLLKAEQQHTQSASESVLKSSLNQHTTSQVHKASDTNKKLTNMMQSSFAAISSPQLAGVTQQVSAPPPPPLSPDPTTPLSPDPNPPLSPKPTPRSTRPPGGSHETSAAPTSELLTDSCVAVQTGASQLSEPQSSSQSSAESLTLQHAVSKSKLSRAISSSRAPQKADVPLQHAASKSRLSRVRAAGPGKGLLSQTLQQEAVNFMVGVMDECTHLGNFSQPVDPRLIIIVAATQDAYVPRHGVIPLDQLWPGCEIRYLSNRGHIAAFLLSNDVFRRAIEDSFNKQVELYYQS